MTPEWIEEIYTTGLAIEDYRSRASSDARGTEKVVGNKLVKKLL